MRAVLLDGYGGAERLRVAQVADAAAPRRGQVRVRVHAASLNPIDWFSSKPSGPKPAELPVLSNAQPVKVLWSASIGAAEGFFFSPIMIGDRLAV